MVPEEGRAKVANLVYKEIWDGVFRVRE